MRRKFKGKKRKILGYAVLALIFLFRQPRLASDRSSNYKSQVAHERVIENCDTSAPIIETETGITLTDEIILVKNDGILPGADGFALNNNPFGGPRIRRGSDVLGAPNTPGLGNIPKGPTVRPFKEVDTGLDARRGNRGDQCPAFNMYQEHQEFVQKMKEKGHMVDDIDCDLTRFKELSTNPETGDIDRKSITEARTIVQSEKENLISNGRRPDLSIK
jgi:hypothetical protein